jgi:hypothetical protein
LDYTNNTSNVSNSIERKASIDSRNGNKLARRQSFVKHDSTDGLDIYYGPFMLNNLFTIPAQELKLKILNFLQKQKAIYQEIGRWKIEIEIDSELPLKVIFNKIPVGAVLLRFSDCGFQPSIMSKILQFLH